MSDVLAHDPLPAFLMNFFVDKSQDGVVRIKGAFPLWLGSAFILKEKFEAKVMGEIGLF